jgi:hypothetical protein
MMRRCESGQARKINPALDRKGYALPAVQRD